LSVEDRVAALFILFVYHYHIISQCKVDGGRKKNVNSKDRMSPRKLMSKWLWSQNYFEWKKLWKKCFDNYEDAIKAQNCRLELPQNTILYKLDSSLIIHLLV